jgi:anthranilate/para-aminobenzoate synthase component II
MGTRERIWKRALANRIEHKAKIAANTLATVTMSIIDYQGPLTEKDEQQMGKIIVDAGESINRLNICLGYVESMSFN